jgi:hypothetical protein
MKKIIIGIAILAAIALLSMGLTTAYFTSPEYAKKFTGYRSLTGVDTIVGTACDTIITNLHTCFENYYAPGDTTSSLQRTTWCLGVYGDAPADSIAWQLKLSLSYDLIHWNYRGVIATHAIPDDSLILYSITKDADILQYLRIIRTGTAANDVSSGSIGEILLFWQNRGNKLGNEVGIEH